MRVLVCGGRDYNDHHKVYGELDNLYDKHGHVVECLIAGGARGADTLAERYADYKGWNKEIYPAKWNVYGKRAGYVRNQQMLDEGKPDLVLAFPGGRGTEMMCQLAEKAGVEVWRIK